jgi:hypothetical protein
VDLSKYNMLGIAPNETALEDSVREDVTKLRESPLIAPDIKIYGFTYDVFVSPCLYLWKYIWFKHMNTPFKALLTAQEGRIGSA